MLYYLGCKMVEKNSEQYNCKHIICLLKPFLFFQDEILSNCSENINLLHNFLESIHTAQSFVQRKKSRETRRKFV